MSKAAQIKQNARQSWRWASTWAIGAQAFLALLAGLPTLLAELPALWAMVPEEIKSLIPASYLPWIMLSMAICTFIARIWPQGSE